MNLSDYAGETASTLRIPPHSIEAEQSVLGGLLLDNTAWDRAGDVLTDSHFYSFQHQLIFAAIRHLVNAALPADVITVFDRLDSLGKGTESGGRVYLNSLAQSVPSAANIRRYAEIVREQSVLRKLVSASDEIATSAFNPHGRPISEILRAAQLTLSSATSAAELKPLFATVDLSELGAVPQEPQQWYWNGYVPAGHLTYFGGHGGAGKSTLGLLLACCIALGRECLGKHTSQAVVCLFSAEDPRDLLLRRLERLCRAMDMDFDELKERLIIIDATEFDPVLFAERRIDGMRAGATTPTYDALAKFVEANQIDVLIVDNASDTFEGDEINRAMVRAFVRSLVRIMRPRNGAVILMAHVDKGTSRAGKGPTNSESYSGSTAWHNSARSRLFLVEKGPGELELQHQKCNLGPRLPPLAIEWPADGIPTAQSAAVGPMQHHLDDGAKRALLRLIDEYFRRGEYVAVSPQSRSHAVKLLAEEKTYPDRKPNEVFALLRDADREGLVSRDVYKDANRKQHERWMLTPKGCEFAGLAPCAPCAPSTDIEAPGDGAAGARHVRHVHGGGYGGLEQRTSSAPEVARP